MKKYNLIFHKILKEEKDIDDKYNISLDYYISFLKEFNNAIRLKQNKESYTYQIYFDDGDDSFIKLILPLIKPNEYCKFTLAIVTDWINKEGYLSEQEIISLNNLGINIASHGTSHSALAVSKKLSDRNTPINGEYRDGVFGFEQRLSENEVIYQFIESKKRLTKLGISVNEFVFPFGLYNDTTVRVNYELGTYKYLSTCDEYLDEGQLLRPRYLIDNERSIDETIKSIFKLDEKYIYIN